MKRSKKLDGIHSLLILLFSIICITGAVFLCYDKCVVAYICWCVCILIVPCVCVLNFEYRLALREEVFNEIKNREIEKWCTFEEVHPVFGNRYKVSPEEAFYTGVQRAEAKEKENIINK